MSRLNRQIARLLNSLFGSIVPSFWAVGVAAFAAFAFFQAAVALEAGDPGGALFLAIFGCFLVILANLTARARETFTDVLRGESEITAGWRLLTALSKRR